MRPELLEDRLAPAVVTIDPGAFTGRWVIAGNGTAYIGRHDVDVAPGSQGVQIAAENTLITAFDTDADGNVTVHNTVAAEASGNIITLHTASILVNTGGFAGRWELAGDDAHIGTGSVTVVVGVTGAQLAAENTIVTSFDTDAVGNVTVRNAASSESAGNTITFHTSVMTVDPGAFAGRWALAGDDVHLGADGVGVINGVVGGQLFAENTLITSFDTDATGNVTVQNTAATEATGHAVTFHTSLMTVNPGAFAGRWALAGDDVHLGADGVGVINGVAGGQLFAENTLITSFDTDATGNVTVHNTIATESSGHTITFHTSLMTVDPGAYSGRWALAGDDAHLGIDGVNVIVGVTAAQLFAENALVTTFDTDASGNVTVQNTAACDSAGQLVTFHTFTLTVSNYDGLWWISGDEPHLGEGTAEAIRNVRGAQMFVSTSTSFLFDSDTAGNVTSQNAAYATGVGSTLLFNTVTIHIDPGDFIGRYRSDVSQTFGFVSGRQDVGVFRNSTNQTIDFFAYTSIVFDVDGDGNIINHTPSMATASGNTLRFRTGIVRVDPADYTGVYTGGFINLDAPVSGFQSFAVVLNTSIGFGEINGSEISAFIDENGVITLEFPDTADVIGDTIRFKTTTIHVDPGDYTGGYQLGYLNPIRFGPTDNMLLSGSGSYIGIGDDAESFNLDADGNPDVSELNFTVNGQSVTLHLSKGTSSSADTDGVNDDVEARAPNGGDGNNDGILDSQQDNVASLPTSVDGDYVMVVAPTGTQLGAVVVDAALPGVLPQAVAFPDGVVDYQVSDLAPGQAVTVTLLFADGQTPNTYYMFGPTPDDPTPHWYEFLYDGTTGAEILPGRIILHLVDGDRGDNDLTANGVIADPGAPSVATTTVNFDPGDYHGTYQITGHSAVSGTSSLSLTPGTYTLTLPNDSITFDVDPFGMVTSRNTAAAIGGSGSLRLITSTVTLDQGAYTGAVALNGVPGLTGVTTQTFTVVPGLRNYALTFGGATGLTFDVDGNGDVTSRYFAAAEGNGSTLRLHTTTVTVERNGYDGWLGVVNYATGTTTGDGRFVLVMGLSGYTLSFGGDAKMTFDLDSTGHAISHNTAAADASLAILHLHSAAVHVDPADYQGRYSLGATEPTNAGPDFNLVPNIDNYAVYVGDDARVLFQVNAGGSVTSHNPQAIGTTGSTLTFQTSKIIFDPTTYTETFSLGATDPTPLSGITSLRLVTNTSGYHLTGPGGLIGSFGINASGEPTTAILSGTVSGQPVTFLLYTKTPPALPGSSSPPASGGNAGTETAHQPRHIVAVGTVETSQVNVYDTRSGALKFNLGGFPGVTGGVQIATGDVNGDGVADIATVGVPGSPAVVVVYDGVTGGVRLVFDALPGYLGGTSLALGDVDGDGRAEIIIGLSSGLPAFGIFDGQSGKLIRGVLVYPGVNVGVNVATGDLDGDGVAEIIVTPTGIAPAVSVFDGAGRLRFSFFAFDPAIAGVGLTVGTADLDGDGRAELLLGANVGGNTYAIVYDAHATLRAVLTFPRFQSPAGDALGPSLRGADLNGDGVEELLVALGPYLGAFDGRTLAPLGAVAPLGGAARVSIG